MANEQQLRDIPEFRSVDHKPLWIHGDGRNVLQVGIFVRCPLLVLLKMCVVIVDSSTAV